jgi:hypothetical protein
MTIRTHAARLASVGIILKDEPSDVHPALPSGKVVVLALRVPAGQAAALAELDGADTDEANPPAGRAMRRLLRLLREDDDILAWRFFREGAQGWVHLQVTDVQARQWFRHLDFAASTRVFEAQRPGHVFFGG